MLVQIPPCLPKIHNNKCSIIKLHFAKKKWQVFVTFFSKLKKVYTKVRGPIFILFLQTKNTE